MYQPRRHLSQMHIMNHFYREKGTSWVKNMRSIMGGGLHRPFPFESATDEKFVLAPNPIYGQSRGATISGGIRLDLNVA